MSNYKKDKSYIKQRLEYVDSVDYISELEEQIENLQEENEILLKKSYKDDVRITKAIEFIEEKISSTQGVINDYMYHKEHNKILIELLREDIEMYKKELNILGGDEE